MLQLLPILLTNAVQTEVLPKAASAPSPIPKPKAKEPKSHKAKNAAVAAIAKKVCHLRT